jgi:hypothetical protein
MKTPVVNPSARTALIVALAATLFIVVVAFASGALRSFLHGEDGFVENMSAVAYAAAFLIAVQVARETTGWQRVHWLTWAVLAFVFFGEETSWLQHWTGYATPESVKAINVQSEFNLHNLRALSPDDRIFSGDGVVFTWKHLLSAQHLFNLGFTVYFLFLPLFMGIKDVGALARRYGIPKQGTRFVAMVWTPIAVSIVLTIANRGQDGSKSLIGETREMFFALAILWFVAAAYACVREQKNARVLAATTTQIARA